MTAVESVLEQQRRAWVERQERHRDVQEVYATELGRLSDARERQELMNKHAAYLHAHRAVDVTAGKRLAGTAVLSRQVMLGTMDRGRCRTRVARTA